MKYMATHLLQSPIFMISTFGRLGLTSFTKEIAEELADQMFDRWEFDAQIKGVLDNDFRPIPGLERRLGRSRMAMSRAVSRGFSPRRRESRMGRSGSGSMAQRPCLKRLFWLVFSCVFEQV